MPVVIDETLPAYDTLKEENIFVITENRAVHQDIRPLKILILNLMPTKIATETQLLRLLGNTPLQVEIDFLKTASYVSQNVSSGHLERFYKSFDEIKDHKYDGFVITGAPVEHLPFESVAYWEELSKIMAFSKTHVQSTLHICWGAQAGLYYHYGIKKQSLKEKMFGVFQHNRINRNYKLLRGFDDEFFVPHSRHTEVLEDDIANCQELEILSTSGTAGVYLIASRDRRQIFATGHAEYDLNTLKLEYERDVNKGLDISVPHCYFKDDDPLKEPVMRWKSHANLLFSNWLNYYVYQATPYNIDAIE